MITTASGALRYVLDVHTGVHIGELYPCDALSVAKTCGVISDTAAQRAKARINELLGTHATLGDWVIEHSPDAAALKCADTTKFYKSLHSAWVAWIEDMIKWHQANGD